MLTLMAQPAVQAVNIDAISGKLLSAHVVECFDWIQVGNFTAGFTYWFDPLTILMLCVVTGVGTLVVIYAAGYMKGDPGYARFFAYVSLFIFAMTTLVMADNLVLLYLGWEGVGLCSYLLIGYYYKKPTAVAAAKKAFIVNRIGDLGFALGIFLTYYHFDTVRFGELLPLWNALLAGGGTEEWSIQLIPYLLMLGAFGKSAQLPLYVWLPDAMEGPTPVSALIHAATMVTAGVYMIVRLLPIFTLSPYALPTVATVGALTALFAATIALCQYDLKKVFAYSTISQLGYMFLGVGAVSIAADSGGISGGASGEGAVGGVFHLFTHAFFKALLFLTAGSVMHACAGQLDLRKLSGLRHKMPVTCWLMFVGCLALAGVPFTAGFFSKDTVLAATLAQGMPFTDAAGVQHAGNYWYVILALIGLLTALLTALYTFRLWFRVFLGPVEFTMGDEHHEEEERHGGTEARRHEGAEDGDTHGADDAHGANDAHHEPHEMPWLMNGPLVVLAVGAIVAGYMGGWIESSVAHATAGVAMPPSDVEPAHHTLFGMDLHVAMMVISGIVAGVGIMLASWFHWFDRDSASALAGSWPRTVLILRHKYFVDELYDAIIVRPLRMLGNVFFQVDRLIIDGLVMFIGVVPRWIGLSVRPTQRGVLQGYGLGMVTGVAAIAILVWLALT